MNKPKFNSPLSYLMVAGGTLLFYMCAIPVADSLSNLMQQAMTNKIVSLQKTQAKLQKELEELGAEPSCVHAIGFQVDSDEEDYDDED